MGACLGQETAHKASLDSFLGNHDEVKFIHYHYGSQLRNLCTCVSGHPGVGGGGKESAITSDVHAVG